MIRLPNFFAFRYIDVIDVEPEGTRVEDEEDGGG